MCDMDLIEPQTVKLIDFDTCWGPQAVLDLRLQNPWLCLLFVREDCGRT